MGTLRDSFLRSIRAYVESGQQLLLPEYPHEQANGWTCCMGAIEGGPVECTCWEPVYDGDQVYPTAETVVALALGDTTPQVRDGMCGGCAYRPGSPERTGDPAYVGDEATLNRWAREQRFWCHQGFRQPVAWKHPDGLRIPTDRSYEDYQPLIIDGIPYQTDGSPGLLCAGWTARRRTRTKTDKERG